jgi:iduronate 2-sulfatase
VKNPSRPLFSAFCAAALFALPPAASAAETIQKKNVLFLIADDLNTLLGCYGEARMRTPHIDALAARGVRFERAYCAFPLCGPSRNSLLTGLYPNATGIQANSQIFRQTCPERISLPQAFRQQGYFAARVGKLYHYGVPNGIGTDGADDPASWEMQVNPAGVDRTEEHPKIFSLLPGNFGGTLSWYASPRGDEHHTDGKVAADAEWILERCAKRKDQPFFLAVGFYRPHTPYVSPKTPYFDWYPLNQTPVAQVTEEERAQIPPAALASFKNEQKQLTDDLRREALQAYSASISFMDAQLGRVIAALDRLGLSESTIIVFTSDHGYHTGEHGLWQKQSLFEESARVPLLLIEPGSKDRKAVAVTPVSHVDLYPTLAKMAGIHAPEDLPGQDLTPILKNPETKGRGWALTQVVRGGGFRRVGSSPAVGDDGKRYFGYTLRTARWRYTEWDEGRQGRQLYDHDADPKELRNLASKAEHAATVAELSAQLQAAVKTTFPPGGETPRLLHTGSAWEPEAFPR